MAGAAALDNGAAGIGGQVTAGQNKDPRLNKQRNKKIPRTLLRKTQTRRPTDTGLRPPKSGQQDTVSDIAECTNRSTTTVLKKCNAVAKLSRRKETLSCRGSGKVYKCRPTHDGSRCSTRLLSLPVSERSMATKWSRKLAKSPSSIRRPNPGYLLGPHGLITTARTRKNSCASSTFDVVLSNHR